MSKIRRRLSLIAIVAIIIVTFFIVFRSSVTHAVQRKIERESRPTQTIKLECGTGTMRRVMNYQVKCERRNEEMAKSAESKSSILSRLRPRYRGSVNSTISPLKRTKTEYRRRVFSSGIRLKTEPEGNKKLIKSWRRYNFRK